MLHPNPYRDERAAQFHKFTELLVARTIQSRAGPGRIYSKCLGVIDAITFGRLGPSVPFIALCAALLPLYFFIVIFCTLAKVPSSATRPVNMH